MFKAEHSCATDDVLDQAKATGWRKSGRREGGGVSSKAVGGTTKSPSSEAGENERLDGLLGDDSLLLLTYE